MSYDRDQPQSKMNYAGSKCTHKKPTRVESVDIDADEKDGQVVEPAREIQVSDMMAATSRKRSAALFLTFALPRPVPWREVPVD